MRKLISVISAAAFVGVVAGSTGAAATPSCVLDGIWTASNPGGRTTFTTKVVVATHAITVDRTGGGLPNAHIDGTFTYDAASGKVTMTNTAVSTQDAAFFACLNVTGTYTLTFTDCTHFTLGLVSDQCMPRTMGPGRATFTKQ
jgi:hypothetical protein